MKDCYMDDWYHSNYAFDIDKSLKESELFGRKIMFQSPQLKYRAKLIDWIRSVSEKLSLSNVTVHLGVFLIDKFMDNHSIMTNRLTSVAIICLLIAAKFEEQDCCIPKLVDLSELVDYEMSVEELVLLEIFILKAFNWRVSWPTPANFAEYYALYALNSGDNDYIFTQHGQLYDAVHSSLRDFLDITLSDVALLNFRSSKVAAACLLAARLEQGIKPLWPPILVQVTGYSIPDLQPAFNVIVDAEINDGRKRKFEETLESGYESSSPDCIKLKGKLLFKK